MTQVGTSVRDRFRNDSSLQLSVGRKACCCSAVKRSASIWLALPLLLAACSAEPPPAEEQDTGAPTLVGGVPIFFIPDNPAIPVQPIAAPGPRAFQTSLLPALFKSVCRDHLPDFATAEPAMAATGNYIRGTSGAIFHKGYNISIRLHTGTSPTCEIGFYSTDSTAQAFANLKALVASTNSSLAGRGQARAASGPIPGYYTFTLSGV